MGVCWAARHYVRDAIPEEVLRGDGIAHGLGRTVLGSGDTPSPARIAFRRWRDRLDADLHCFAGLNRSFLVPSLDDPFDGNDSTR